MSDSTRHTGETGVEQLKTLGDIVRVQAALQPEAPALVYGDRVSSFRELEAMSNKTARRLGILGLGRPARIAIFARNTDAFFPVLFGTAKAGHVLVTINFRLTVPEITYILNDSGAELVFCETEFAEKVEACRPDVRSLKHVVVMDGGQGSDDSLETWFADLDDHAPEIEVTPDDTAIQMYTSGTTGVPKGVELTHEAMIVAAQEGLTLWRALFAPDRSVLATMPLFHIAAANLGIAGLAAGARVEIVREATVLQTLQLIAGHRITIAPLPATVIHQMTQLEEVKHLDLSHLDTLLIAGSGIPVELLRTAQEVLGCGFALSYGMTECCGGLSYLGPGDCTYDAGEKLKSAGRVFGENKIRIVDAKGNDLPAGETGEILCDSRRVMKSYWNRPDATREALRAGWYHSGDAGYLDADGYLFVVDRIKDMVISGGENIYPVEIENELIKHPGVHDVAVVGTPDSKWGEALVGVIVSVSGKPLDKEDLISFLRGRLAGYKIPRRYEYVDSLPRNTTGKVLKRVLRDQFSN